MNKILDYLKENKRYLWIIKGLIALIFPLILCVIYLAVRGKTIGDVYLPESEWNDELYYFKQVEGILDYGYPQGYFGFNESHAEALSFAAWSPVLVFPWLIWGTVFGWNLLSPIICNIVLLGLACLAFVLLTKPNIKQMITLGVLMSVFVLFERYMLSGMPEIICFSLAILFISLAYNALLDDKIWKIIILFVMAAVMTLMRPYLLLFLLLPIFMMIRKKKILGIVISAGVLAVTLAAYACIKKFLGADYFAPLFFTDWLTDFFKFGFVTGLDNLVHRVFYMSRDFAAYSIKGIRAGDRVGAFFVTYIVMMIIFIVQTVIDFISLTGKKDKEQKNISSDERSDKDKLESKKNYARFVMECHYMISLFGMLTALILMYKLEEGSKHLLTFIAAGIFIIVLLNNKTYIKYIAMAICFVFFFIIKGTSPYDYAVPYVNEQTVEKQETWEKVFADEITFTDDAPNFDNVVIWNWRAYKNGNPETMKWQRLYALPSGCGISCCYSEYVIENLDSLNSKYITTLAGSDVDILLSERGYEKIYADEETAFYRLR